MPFRRSRHKLRHDTTGAPYGLQITCAICLQNLTNGKPDAGGDLLGLAEILLGGFFQSLLVQRNNTLIARHFIALIDRQAKLATPEHFGRRHAIDETRGVKTGIASHPVGRFKINHQHIDGTIGAGLDLETAFKFQSRAQKHRQRHRLPEQLRHRIGIGVTAQDLIHHRPKPDRAAANIKCFDGERQNLVVGQLHK